MTTAVDSYFLRSLEPLGGLEELSFERIVNEALRNSLVQTLPPAAGDLARRFEEQVYLIADQLQADSSVREFERAGHSSELGWMRAYYQLLDSGKRHDAIDLLFDTVDDWLLESRFRLCDEMLETLDLQKLDITAVLAVLSITKPATEKLGSRADFVQRATARINELDSERAERLLEGLV